MAHDASNDNRYTRGLAEFISGQRWETMGVALKFYSCVGSNHTTLDAVLALEKLDDASRIARLLARR